jgi:hypothetical protein
MDREDDILFMILTSHGSQAGVAVRAGRREETLSPAALAGMLGRTGVQRKQLGKEASVVGISRCSF